MEPFRFSVSMTDNLPEKNLDFWFLASAFGLILGREETTPPCFCFHKLPRRFRACALFTALPHTRAWWTENNRVPTSVGRSKVVSIGETSSPSVVVVEPLDGLLTATNKETNKTFDACPKIYGLLDSTLVFENTVWTGLSRDTVLEGSCSPIFVLFLLEFS